MNFVKSAAAALLTLGFSSAASAVVIELDFEKDSNNVAISHGQVIDSEYNDWGVTISAENIGGGPQISTTYSSTPGVNPNRDPDLKSPWSGGNIADGTYQDAGNLLIIQENAYRCGDGICDRPDDEGSRPAGSLFFYFDNWLESVSFDLIDIEIPEQVGAKLIFLNDEGAEITDGEIFFTEFEDGGAFDSDAEWGNNFYNVINTIDILALGLDEAVYGLEFYLGGSGALDNIKVSAVPVPGAMLLVGIALFGLGSIRRVRRRKQAA